MSEAQSQEQPQSSLAGLTLGAIGVVYGDIGTSVLYSIKEVFGSGHVAFTPDNIMGILSLFFWTLTFIVSLKYVTLVLRADNNGEGGLVAMLALASSSVRDKPRLRSVLLVVGIFGTCLFYGDGVITPAISVLSAVEGLEVVSPTFKRFVIPLTLLILLCLFAVQKRGTGGIGKFFGPITLVWFIAIAMLGVYHIVDHPEILWAVSPHYAAMFVWDQPFTAFIILGAVVLCVTGGEALYADMGHFGKKPIRLAWFSIVMPCLTLNYFGQGALLLAEPEAVKNPFFNMAPDWALIPLVILATAATVIASQALITGAFSVTKQVIQLGFLPRLQILHTSEKETGQIYMPLVNWGLFVVIVLAVVMFKTSSNLAAAYGIAVCTDMLITTILTFYVIRYAWKYPLWLCISATSVFFVVDLAFWSSNMLKLADGGWFPLVIGGMILVLMLTWRDGRALLHHKTRNEAMDLSSFLSALFLAPPTRVEGIAVFLTSEDGIVPNAMLHNLKHNKVLHERNVLLRVDIANRPYLPEEERCQYLSLGPGFESLTLRFGFMESPNVSRALPVCRRHGLKFDVMMTSFFLGRRRTVVGSGKGPGSFLDRLYVILTRMAADPIDYFYLPRDRVVEIGARVSI